MVQDINKIVKSKPRFGGISDVVFLFPVTAFLSGSLVMLAHDGAGNNFLERKAV